MTRCRRPGVFEQRSDLTRAHFAALEIERHQNMPARRMRERGEHRFIRVGKRPGRPFRQSHPPLFSRSTFSVYAKCRKRKTQRPSSPLISEVAAKRPEWVAARSE